MTGPRFRAQVQEGMEAYTALLKLQQAEKKSAHKRWRHQEAAMEKLLASVHGIAGSVSGLGGDAVGSFDEPDVLALEAGDEEEGAS